MSDIPLDQIVDFVIRIFLPFSTLLVLWLAFRIASRTLVRSVTPQVECFVRPCPSSQKFELVIANYGLGSAYNVSLNLDVDEDDFVAHRVSIQWLPTEMPFGIIEPGGSITTFFGMGQHLMGNEPYLKPFTAVIEYEWQPFWTKRRKNERRSYNMDVRPFYRVTYLENKNEIAKTLESELRKIADSVKARSNPL